MALDQMANQDFERAVRKSFWRRIITKIRGEENDLLPFDEVREKIKIQGQRYIGLRQVEVEKIIGSVGRYRDFDRIFLPVQKRTRSRWVSVDKAHYEQIPLPPVDLYKIGEVYFVKDGNHRVSVARQRGQEFVDAYIIEIDIPVNISLETSMKDLDLKQENAEFILKSGINKLRPEVNINATLPGIYTRMLEHIDVHRWYLGESSESDISYEEAVTSWYDSVYSPVVDIITENDLLDIFPNICEADLYVWILEYAGYLRQLYQLDETPSTEEHKAAEKELISNYPYPEVKKIIQIAKKDNWLNEIIIEQEKAAFDEYTHILELVSGVDIVFSLPGQYDQLLEHIAVHRWYLGEENKEEIALEEAVVSWYDQIYWPIIKIIREQEILTAFPNRTEADLYMWIVKRQSELMEIYGDDIAIEKAIEQVTKEIDD